MSSHSFSDITQTDWIRACRKLGLQVQTHAGKGSHVLVVHPQTNHKYTIQHHLHKFINLKIFKKMLEWGYAEERVWEALR